MTTLAEIATARLERASIDAKIKTLEATICADPKCKHPLSDHSVLFAVLPDDGKPKGLGSCRGLFLGPPCKCRGWRE